LHPVNPDNGIELVGLLQVIVNKIAIHQY
jgi:hypothetical protein